ncbi:MAG: hypothetical protein WBL28_04250 [Methylotenera sp.]
MSEQTTDAIEKFLTGQTLLPSEPLTKTVIAGNEVEQKSGVVADGEDRLFEQLSDEDYKTLSKDYLKAANEGTTKQLVETLTARIKEGTAPNELLSKLLDAHIVEQKMAANNRESVNEGGPHFSDTRIRSTVAELLTGNGIPDFSYEMRNGAFKEIMSSKEALTSNSHDHIEHNEHQR